MFNQIMFPGAFTHGKTRFLLDLDFFPNSICFDNIMAWRKNRVKINEEINTSV